MIEVSAELLTPFTTADTIGPVSVSYSGDKLAVTFANHGTPVQTVEFSDVRAFSWTGWDDVPAEASPDRVYRVEGSAFLAPWQRFSVGGAPFIHFKLGFVSEGKFLDVVATRMEQKPANQSLQPTAPSGRG